MQRTAETFLDEIITKRTERVKESRRRVPLDRLMRAAESRAGHRSFSGALSRSRVSLIAEMKRASPSAGQLRAEYPCAELARAYEAAGAAALSVLTEEDYFQGSLDDLREGRAAVRLAVLRKDFIIDPYQVYESAAAGADALLLIVAALPDRDLRALIDLSARLNVEILVEVHTERELSRAIDAGARIIGVNNRNLKTLEVSLETSFRLREKIPAGYLAVTESGIKSPPDLRRLIGAGFDAALIGEQFMRAADPGRALAEMLAGAQKDSDP